MTGDHHFRPPGDWQPLTLTDPDVAADGGWSVWRVDVTGSTNADLLGQSDAPDRTVLVAGHQTAGRGRLDRRWDAPPDTNLLTSILFRTVPEDATELTRRVGVAALDAVRAVAGVEASLKWPNDVLVEGRKVAGILAQRAGDGRVVVGLGLNVGWAPGGAAALGSHVDRVALLTELLRRLAAERADWFERYTAALSTLGRRVRVELPATTLEGTAIDVERDGRLVVLDACAVSHRVDVGDVVHLRDA